MTRTSQWWKTYAAHLQGAARQPTSLRPKDRVIADCIQLCRAVGSWSGDYTPVARALDNFLESNGVGSRQIGELCLASKQQWAADKIAAAMQALKLSEFIANYGLGIAERFIDDRQWVPVTVLLAQGSRPIPLHFTTDHQWVLRVEDIVPSRRAENLRAVRHMPTALPNLPELPGFQFENDRTFYCADAEGTWRHYPYTAITIDQLQGVLRYFIAGKDRLAMEWLAVKGLVFGSGFDTTKWLRERPAIKQLVREHFHRENLPEDLYIEFEPIVMAIVSELTKKTAVTARVTAKQQSLREQISHDIRKRAIIEVTTNRREIDI